MVRDYIENSNYKSRKLAGLPANFVIGRIWYEFYNIEIIENLGSATNLSSLDRGMEIETFNNGLTSTSLPKKGGNKALNIVFEGNNPIMTDWFARVENKMGAYFSDCVILLLNGGTNTFFRAVALKNAWVSNISTNAIDTRQKDDSLYKETITLEHSGWRFIDPGDTVKISFTKTIDNNEYIVYNTIEYKKDENNFYCEKDGFGNNYTYSYLL
jgi:hypothetical protein